MRVIFRKIRHARYLYIKRNVGKVWGARYILGARYLSKNMVIINNPTNSARNIPSHSLCIFTAPNWPGHPNCQGYTIIIKYITLGVIPLDE